MKKLFIAVLALSALVACNKDEVVQISSSSAIQFEQAFVDNATRAAQDPSTTTENLTQFEVYGFMDEVSGVVFNDELVSKTGETWSYVNTQYWTPGHTYYFGALAPVDGYTLKSAAGSDALYGVGEVTFENTDGSADLIYAPAVQKNVTEEFAANPSPVELTFNHLLSKIKFTFENGFKNENAKIVVKDIKMTVPSEGKINLAQEDWWSTNQWVVDAKNANATTLEFGTTDYITVGKKEECADERLTIPQSDDAEYTITFTASLYYGTVEAGSYDHEITLKGNEFKIGYAYNICATLNADNINPDNALLPIEFTVIDVKEWEDGDVVTGGNLLATEVKTADQLITAIGKNESVVLQNDITLDGMVLEINAPATVKSEAAAEPQMPIFINLNGNTLKGAIKASVPVTIENGKIVDNDIFVEYKTKDGKKIVKSVIYADNTLVTLNNVEVESDYTAILAYNNDEDTVPAKESEPATGLIINGSELRSKDTEVYYALYTAGYNKVDIINSQLSGPGAAYLCSSKVKSVDSDFSASVYFGLYLACSYVDYDVNTSINGTAADIHVFDYGKDIWASYINGEKAVYGNSQIPTTVADESSLKAAMENGGTYILADDITITSPLTVENNNVILFLNGHNITNRTTFSDSGDEANPNFNCYVFWVKEKGNLTIKGEGTVSTDALTDNKPETKEWHIAVWAQGGTVNIYGGSYYNSGEGSDLIYASVGGTVNIYGGYFQAIETIEGVEGTKNKYTALNLKDKTGADINVFGGSYYMFDPSNNYSENPSENFVQDGYKVETEGHIFKVVAK